MEMGIKPINILLVEDNEGDILLTTEALQEGNIDHKINIAKNGWDAIKLLEKMEKDSNQDLPDLILLDINLPKMSGHEVLKHIKTTDNIKHIPVIMLSTSSADIDIFNSYRNYASCYITKPVDLQNFFEAIETLEEFWISTVQLPKKK